VSASSASSPSPSLIAFLTHTESGDAIRAAMGATPHAIELGDAAAAAVYLASHPSPDVLLVEIPSAEEAPAMLDQLADVVHARTRVIVTGPVDSYRFYEWLLKLGIHDYLLQPFTAAQLVESLKKGHAPEAKTETPARSKKVIAAIGARGGVGTTTLLTTLAACIARNHEVPSVAVDLDPHFGSMALALDLEPGRAMRDVWEKPDRIDSLYLERTMIKPFTPLSMLSTEESLNDIIVPQANAGERLIATLKESYDLLAFDVPRQITPLSRYVLANADHVLLVAEPTVLSLRDILRVRDLLVEQARRPAPLLVLNRVGLYTKSQLSESAVAKHVGMDVALSLGYYEDIADTVARGELLLRNTKLVKPLEPLCMLADRLMGIGSGTSSATPAKRRLLPRIGAK